MKIRMVRSMGVLEGGVIVLFYLEEAQRLRGRKQLAQGHIASRVQIPRW